MGRGGKGHADPLVTKSGLTAVEVGGQKYLCTFAGTNGREIVTSIARVIDLMGDRNSANPAARRLCDKGQNAIVGIDTDGRVYVAVELEARDARGVAEQISAERQHGRGRRTGEFVRHRDAAGGSEPIAVDHTSWAESIALRYLDGSVETLRITAVDQLPTVCGADNGKRTAMVAALETVADVCDSGNDGGRATVLRRIAEELTKGTLHL